WGVGASQIATATAIAKGTPTALRTASKVPCSADVVLPWTGCEAVCCSATDIGSLGLKRFPPARLCRLFFVLGDEAAFQRSGRRLSAVATRNSLSRAFRTGTWSRHLGQGLTACWHASN